MSKNQQDKKPGQPALPASCDRGNMLPEMSWRPLQTKPQKAPSAAVKRPLNTTNESVNHFLQKSFMKLTNTPINAAMGKHMGRMGAIST